MERLTQRIVVAHQALDSLREVVAGTAATRVERDAAIQRFEYTLEAVWRASQRYLGSIEGLTVASPKGTIRFCREVGMLSDDQAIFAIKMVDDRNLTARYWSSLVGGAAAGPAKLDHHRPLTPITSGLLSELMDVFHGMSGSWGPGLALWRRSSIRTRNG